jgi:nitroreductase
MRAAAPALAALMQRRSVSPRRLGGPGPSADDWQAAVAAALRAPDHGGLVPWRMIEIPPGHRESLARLFADEKLRRDPMASADDLDRARSHALQASGLAAFVVSPRRACIVPLHEQWLAAGAALGNVLNALQAIGYGAIILSGDRCADRVLCRALGVSIEETLAGFISAGTVLTTPAEAAPKCVEGALQTWHGPLPEKDGSSMADLERCKGSPSVRVSSGAR